MSYIEDSVILGIQAKSRQLEKSEILGFGSHEGVWTEKKMNIEALDMTDNITKFVEFVGKLKAYAGGDVPENVLGGLDRALHLDWKYPNRIIFHIGIAQLLLYGLSILLYI